MLPLPKYVGLHTQRVGKAAGAENWLPAGHDHYGGNGLRGTWWAWDLGPPTCNPAAPRLGARLGCPGWWGGVFDSVLPTPCMRGAARRVLPRLQWVKIHPLHQSPPHLREQAVATSCLLCCCQLPAAGSYMASGGHPPTRGPSPLSPPSRCTHSACCHKLRTPLFKNCLRKNWVGLFGWKNWSGWFANANSSRTIGGTNSLIQPNDPNQQKQQIWCAADGGEYPYSPNH